MPTFEEYHGMIEGQFLPSVDRARLDCEIKLAFRWKIPALIAIELVAGWMGLGHSGANNLEYWIDAQLNLLRAETVLGIV